MSHATMPVVIVGAGPTGVTAATLLAQYGVECLVLDRWAEMYPQPRAVHLDDEVYRILGRLGVADGFAAISRPTLGLQLRDQNMAVLAEFRRDAVLSANGYPQANMFDQPRFEALLRENLMRCPKATLRCAAEVTEIAETDGRVLVTYTDRVSGDQHQVKADFVLGCDGANSLVRTAIGSSMGDLKFQQRWLVVDVETEAELNQWEGVHQVCDPQRAATFMRGSDTRYRWEFRLLPGEKAADFDSATTLYPLVRPWMNGVAPAELRIVRVAEYTFRAQIADRWRRGNVFLLGDAAHLTPPFIGQGMGAGLRDAMNLCWKLAAVCNSWLPASALESYEQERKPHVRHVIRFALAVGRAMTAGGEVGNLVRRVVVPRLHLIPGVRAKVVDSTTPRLSHGALVLPGRGRRHLAGRLCPNPVLPHGERFDAVVGHRFAVVTCTEPSEKQRDTVTRRGAVVVTAEKGSDLARWLHSGRATAAVVRPDGTVMCAGREVADVCSAVPVFAPERTLADA
ncbi:MAG: 3-(3-hydroxy-phenyl)propionate hydroxylase [Mycobacterium sp.]|jgi:3-(3-hydroxy-phenyl)propionate hydroxylase|nr:3-(3-hydroxy-phenyl)propionate hydroxylase [Mycobacterium sp.]